MIYWYQSEEEQEEEQEQEQEEEQEEQEECIRVYKGMDRNNNK